MLSPAEILINRMVRDIHDSHPPGTLNIFELPTGSMVEKGADYIALSFLYSPGSGSNHVRVHMNKELVKPYLEALRQDTTGCVALPLGRSRIWMRETDRTVTFNMVRALYDDRKADFLALFRFVLDLQECTSEGLPAITDAELNTKP